MKPDRQQPDAATLREVKKLMKRLTSRYLGERLEAQKRIKELGPLAVDALLDIIRRGERELRIRRRVWYAIAGSFALFGLPLVAYLTYLGIVTGNGGLLGGALGGILGGWGGGGVGGTVALLFPGQLQIAAMAALASVDDPRAVGPLAEVAISRMNPSVDARVSAAGTLLRLLPTIDPEQYDLLTGNQRAALYRLLREPHVTKETELTLAVLAAIDRVGDTRALPAVNRLFDSTSGEVIGLTKCHNAAANCRDSLLAQQERAMHAESLVRPAQAPIEESGVLLRAAATTPHSPEELLLRASQDDVR